MAANNLSWADLFAQGSLVDLDISVWAALARLKPGDLGIEATEEVKKALTFGHERLIAKSKLDPIRELEGEARRTVEKYSIPFRLIPGSSYVPKAKREAMESELAEIKLRFGAAVDTFVRDYRANIDAQLPTIKKALLDSAKDATAVDAAMARLEALYPDKDVIRTLFGMRWKVFSISAPVDGTQNSAEADSVREAVGDMIQRLRDEVTARTDDIIALVARGGKLTQRTFNSASALCDRLETLNIFGDVGLATIVAKLRQIINRARDAENSGEVLTSGLAPIADELRASKEKSLEEIADRMTGRAQRKLIA